MNAKSNRSVCENGALAATVSRAGDAATRLHGHLVKSLHSWGAPAGNCGQRGAPRVAAAVRAARLGGCDGGSAPGHSSCSARATGGCCRCACCARLRGGGAVHLPPRMLPLLQARLSTGDKFHTFYSLSTMSAPACPQTCQPEQFEFAGDISSCLGLRAC